MINVLPKTSLSGCLLVLLALVSAQMGCNVDLNVDSKTFGCDADSDCGTGFVCEAGICVSRSTASGGDTSSSSGADIDASSSSGADIDASSSSGADIDASSSSGMDMDTSSSSGMDMDVISGPAYCDNIADRGFIESTVTFSDNGSDTEIVSGYQAALSAAARCVEDVPAGPGHADRVVLCMQGDPYDIVLSDTCSGCFSELLLCVFNHCAQACFGNGGDDTCLLCVTGDNPSNTDCLNPFNSCRGTDEIQCLATDNTCGIICADPMTDHDHCGGCFRNCDGDNNESCFEGTCQHVQCENIALNQMDIPHFCLNTVEGLIGSSFASHAGCWPAGSGGSTNLDFCSDGMFCDSGAMGCRSLLDFELATLTPAGGPGEFVAKLEMRFDIPIPIKVTNPASGLTTDCFYRVSNNSFPMPYPIDLLYQRDLQSGSGGTLVSCTPPAILTPFDLSNAAVTLDGVNDPACPSSTDSSFTSEVLDRFLSVVVTPSLDDLCLERGCWPCGDNMNCDMGEPLLCPEHGAF